MFENKFHGEQISFHVWNRISGDYFPSGLVRKRKELKGVQSKSVPMVLKRTVSLSINWWVLMGEGGIKKHKTSFGYNMFFFCQNVTLDDHFETGGPLTVIL